MVRLSASERRQVYKSLELLDSDERHASLRVHKLTGDLAGLWSASASDVLRIVYAKQPDGTRLVFRATRHYAR